MIYTGIGSRRAPEEILRLFEEIGRKMALEGHKLYSGHADGSDISFEKGCDSVGGAKEIFIPWKGFNNSTSELYRVEEKALLLAESVHPAWNKLSKAGKLLHARNVYQILGKDLKSPSELVICWTQNGAEIGGTATAIKLAKLFNIPVRNLGIPENLA